MTVGVFIDNAFQSDTDAETSRGMMSQLIRILETVGPVIAKHQLWSVIPEKTLCVTVPDPAREAMSYEVNGWKNYHPVESDQHLRELIQLHTGKAYPLASEVEISDSLLPPIPA